MKWKTERVPKPQNCEISLLYSPLGSTSRPSNATNNAGRHGYVRIQYGA